MEQNQALARAELAQSGPRQGGIRRERVIARISRNFLKGISIVIPAHNEEDYIGRTLDALNSQNYPDCEIIVVANGCTDRTAEEAQGKCRRLVALSQKNLGVARNLGARMATGNLLIFLDADTILEPDALRTIAEEFSEENAGGTLHGVPDSDRFAYRLIYWLKNFMHRFVVHNGSSGVIICWKRHFTRVGGFDERLELRENSELIRRLKCFGSYKYISATSATTSMRRYERRGVGKIVWLWIKLWFLSLFGDLRNRKYEPVR
jgi:glycosyltransferase involved in cell wall biosynthesis